MKGNMKKGWSDDSGQRPVITQAHKNRDLVRVALRTVALEFVDWGRSAISFVKDILRNGWNVSINLILWNYIIKGLETVRGFEEKTKFYVLVKVAWRKKKKVLSIFSNTWKNYSIFVIL